MKRIAVVALCSLAFLLFLSPFKAMASDVVQLAQAKKTDSGQAGSEAYTPKRGKFKFDQNKSYTMPATFGGFAYDKSTVGYYHDAVSMSYSYTTDGERLASYLPEGFELMKPELHVAYVQNREVDWMVGAAYNLIQVSVPVRFQGKQDRVEGEFVLVIWENKTEPILMGREQSGQPKIYANIEDLHIFQGNYFASASFEGNTFLRLEMSDAKPVEGPQLAQMKALSAEGKPIGWRYIPKVGGPGAELSQPILYPKSFELKNAWMGSGTLEWIKLKPHQDPMQYHVIEALADLPILRMGSVLMSKGSAVLKNGEARVLK